MNYSVSIIVPSALRDTANKMAEAMGYGPNTYISPLSATGKEPITHYGMHTNAGEAFVKMLGETKTGKIPAADFARAGLKAADPANVIAAMKTKVAPYNPQTYWDLCAELGLKLVEPEGDMMGQPK